MSALERLCIWGCSFCCIGVALYFLIITLLLTPTECIYRPDGSLRYTVSLSDDRVFVLSGSCYGKNGIQRELTNREIDMLNVGDTWLAGCDE